MASNRHLGRIVAMQTLYEFEFRVQCQDELASLDEILERNIERYQDTIEDTDFIRILVNGVQSHQDELDKVIQPIAPDWPINQIARIDRSILRMSLFELMNNKDVPPKVVINEAVELAKAFGGENSSKFINGVLGTAFRNQEGKTKNKKPSKATSKTSKKITKKSVKK